MSDLDQTFQDNWDQLHAEHPEIYQAIPQMGTPKQHPEYFQGILEELIGIIRHQFPDKFSHKKLKKI
jgi:hypothetical protein